MLRGWSVMDRLGEIRVPTLVVAGRDDFLFPPESQAQLAAGIPNARLRIIERAGHNPQAERPAETLAVVADFLERSPVERRRRPGVDEVYVDQSGTPGAPAVVFVHGGGPSSGMWRGHLDRLAGTFHCLAPDLPGFGRSKGLAPISLTDTADLIAELIEARVPGRRAHVVGLSYGGSVAFALLDRHAELLDRVVIDGASPLRQRADPLIVAAIVLVSPLVDSALAARFLGLLGLRDLGRLLRTASPAAFRRSWIEGYTAPISRAVLEAPCPTLLVAGERESARVSNAGLAALMPHATACFAPRLGHAWFAWQRELHIRMVEAWLSDAPLPEGLVPEPPSPTAVDRVMALLERRRPRTVATSSHRSSP
jgi:pimeloyl-ACP methyl ester carboxylesterase